MTVGATSDASLTRSSAEGIGAAEIYGKLRAIRDRYGDLIRAGFPPIPRRVSGYNLDELLPERGFNVARALVGTEGTCAIVLEAKVKLIHSPQHRALVGIGYEDAFMAADHVPEILELQPIGFEGFEGSIVDGLRHKGAPKLDLLPAGGGIVLVEFGADDPEEAQGLARQLIDRLSEAPDAPQTRLYTPAEARLFGICANRGPAPPPLPPARRPSGKAGMTRRSLRKSWAATCVTFAS